MEPRSSPNPQEVSSSETISKQREEGKAFFQMLFQTIPRIWITPALIIINGLIFLFMILKGVSVFDPTAKELLAWGANFGPYTTNKQWWRLLTCAFIHVGIIHITLNLWVLGNIGRLVERLFGPGAFLVLYLLSAVGGSLASMFWNPLAVSAGASGAIFGIYGGLLSFFILQRRTIPSGVFSSLTRNAIEFIGYNVFFGLTVPIIDNMAHLGGLVTGFIAGACLNRALLPRPSSSPIRYLRATLLAVVLVMGAFLVQAKVRAVPTVAAKQHFELGLAHYKKGDWEGAIKEFTRASKLDPNDSDSLIYRGLTRYEKKDLDGAIADYTEALEIDPKSAIAYSNRGMTRFKRGDPTGAIDDWKKAIELEPSLKGDLEQLINLYQSQK
jgi:membrane associated rhomboid family serine protease